MAGILIPNAGLAQFISGSTGADGPLVVSMNTTLPVPEPDGVFNYTTINIASGVTLDFTPNVLNTPVYLLATGDVIVNGMINVDGKNGTGNPPVGGEGGPGGFAGGVPGISGSPSGDGKGPGAGRRGNTAGLAGRGAYGGAASGQAGDGSVYGSPLLVPLVGGSGGGGYDGQPGDGGGGGGGAVLIASDTEIVVTGTISAEGGPDPNNAGSGGGIRLVAPIVRGTGNLMVRGGSGGFGGHGRVRVDVIDRKELQLVVNPVSAYSVGGFMRVFPEPLPRIDLISVAGTAIPEGTTNAVEIFLPLNSPTAQDVVVQARDFTGMVPIRIALTPDSGPAVVEDATINMTTNPATVTVNMDFPVNTPTFVQAFTK
jgi:hypothetical protein